MEGTYPIMFDGVRTGTLTVTREGKRLVFEAECTFTDRLVRLSVYGAEGEGCLGVMRPENGMLKLRRTLTPLEAESFPKNISHAAPCGERGADKVEEAPCADAEPDAPAEEEPKPEAEPDELFWYSSPEGVLVSFDGERGWAAFPEGFGGMPPYPGVDREIEGRKYAVYPMRGGRVQPWK